LSTVLIPALLSFAATFLAERLRGGWVSGIGLAVRVAVHGLLFAAFMALTLRPWFSALLVCVPVLTLVITSEIKLRILCEPLTVTDFRLIPQAIRHPHLYYVDFLSKRPMQVAVPFVAFVCAIVILAFIGLEPPQHWGLGATGARAIWAGTALIIAALLFSSPAERWLAATAAPWRFGLDERRHGLVAALLMTAFARRRHRGASPAARAVADALPKIPAAVAGPALVVVLQLESFVDPVRQGISNEPLPALDALRREAVHHGRLILPYEGAYTMRTEFSMLTGLGPAELGSDATDPFLRAERYGARALPALMREAGYRTTYIHPYDPLFFGRDRVMPALGFEHALFEEAFTDAPRTGPHVCDAAVGATVLDEARRADRAFVFAVTIEAHGPWKPGRLPGHDLPSAQYLQHLRNADRMLGALREALLDWPGGAVLCAYGDHAPARSLALEIRDRRATDYVIWDSRRRDMTGAPAVDRAPEEVMRLLVSHISADTRI
jgi:hypothetical protein